MAKHGDAALLPNDGYDLELDYIEFSAYSPPDIGQRGRMTWRLLHHVAQGLIEYLYDEARDKEAFFKVLDGPRDEFVGYGHVIEKRMEVSQE